MSYMSIAGYKLIMLDSGIFITNLVYALHEKRSDSCILSCYMTEKKANLVKTIVAFPDNEMLAVLFAASRVPANETIKVAGVERPINTVVS